MTDIKTLMEASGMHKGFLGAEYVDRLPHLTLIEATSQLPCIVVEEQINMMSVGRPVRTNLSEAAMQSINESALGTLKDKVEAFFQRMLKWVRSIIAKLKVHIDRINLTGEELFKKYVDKLGKDSDYHGITFNGYRFAAGSKIIYDIKDSFDANIEELVKNGLHRLGIQHVMLPHEFGIRMKGLARKVPEGQTISKDVVDEINDGIDRITDLTHEERTTAMASVLSGRAMVDGWEDDLRSRCWGEKGPINYGTDMFIPRVIGKVLKDDALGECMEGYRRLERAIQDYRGRLKGELADLWDEFYVTTDTLNLPGNLSAQSMIARYYNVYIGCVSDALNAATRLKSLKVSFHTDMHHQAVSMLVKLVNGGKDLVNDSYTGEEVFA